MIHKGLYIKTYGCQMNAYDSQKMADLLHPLGYTVVDTQAEAAVIILNTCHIREKATEKVFSELGRLDKIQKKRGDDAPAPLMVVAGCVAQAEGETISKRAPHVDIVLGPQNYHLLPELLAQAERDRDNKAGPGRGIVAVDFPTESKFDALPVQTQRTSPSQFLTIQEGCDKFCHFCCVPYTRGAEYSRPVADIVHEARTLVADGAKELTLLGQNVNAYHGQGLNGQTIGLGPLLEILHNIDGLERLRYTTSHPRDVDADLIKAHKDLPKLMPLIHLPVQSGSDKILKAMNRKHTAAFYLDIIQQLKEANPQAAFSSDFIVGYPGETDDDFADTLALVEAVTFAQAFSFKYSPRPGTPAAALDSHLPETVQDERLSTLQALLQHQQETFNNHYIGQTVEVLFEQKARKSGQIIGRSPHGQNVLVTAPSHLIGHTLPVTITSSSLKSLMGTVVMA